MFFPLVYPELERKVVLVTGASRGIGRAIAKEFADEGARVAANYHMNEARASDLKKSYGERIELFRADVRQKDEVSSMVESVISRSGRLDILVNNAGKGGVMPIDEYNEEAFASMWETNYLGTLYSTIAALPYLKKSKGCIINIASNAGIGTDTPTGAVSLYAVTKAAVIMLTKRSAFEFGKFGIRVNAIAPGWIETDMTIGGKKQNDIQRVEDEIRARTYLGMVGEPKHISKIATFLASDGAAFITGQIIVADGGRKDNLTHSV